VGKSVKKRKINIKEQNVHGLESITKATTKATTNKIITITIQAAGAA